MTFVPLAANWASEVRESLEFLTAIATVDTGVETSRRAMRQNPRRKIEFEAVLTGAVRRRAVDLISRAQRDECRIPDHTARQVLLSTSPATVAAGTTAITLRSVPPGWMAVGVYLAICEGLRVEEARIAGISGSTITLTAGTSQVFTSNAVMLPCVTGYMAAQLSLAQLTDDVAVVPVSFSVLPGSEIMDGGGAESSEFGIEVFTRRPDYSAEVTHTLTADSIEIDRGWGRVARFTPSRLPGRVMAMDFLGRTRDEVADLVQFFLRAKGRRGPLIVPTWSADAVLTADTPAGTMQVQGTDFAIDDVYQVLAVERTDGTVSFARVTGVAVSGSDSILTLVDQGDRAYTRSQIVRVSWAPLCRFATDSIVVRWLTDSVAVVRFSFQSLIYRDETSDLDEGAAWLVAQYGWPFVHGVIADPLQIIVNVTYPDIVETV